MKLQKSYFELLVNPLHNLPAPPPLPSMSRSLFLSHPQSLPKIFKAAMGQSLSVAAAEDLRSRKTATSPSTENSAQSLDSLIAEAAAYGAKDNSQSLDEKAQKALECPCIAHLKTGPCGSQFSDAFVCFLKSAAEEKGSDCVNPFIALQKCIKANPDAFSKDVLEDEEEVKKEEKPTPKYRIRPPLWSGQSKTPT